MVLAAKIDRDSYYDDEALRRILGLRRGAVQRARLGGELRSTRAGGRILYRGNWVEDWLNGDNPEAEASQPLAEAAR